MKLPTKEWFEKRYADCDKGDAWGVRWRASQAVRYDNCLNFIKKYIGDPGGEILEIGCGFGDFTLPFLNNFPHAKISGIDISHNAVKEIQRLIPSGYFEQSALPDIPFDDDSFGGIMAMEVIYYLDNKKREESIINIHRKLKTGGWFLFTSVIDSGQSYFSNEQALKLIGNYFEIRAIDYNRARIYGFIERPLMKITRLRNVITTSDWNDYLVNDNSSKNMMYRIAQNKFTKTAFMLFYRPLSCFAKNILGIKFIPKLGDEIGRRLLPDSSKTNIMILAEKK